MRQHSNRIDLRRWHSIGSILLFLFASNTAAVAQEKDAVDVVKVNTDLVVFDVQVIDKKTKSVLTDLTEADFQIFDRGKKQTVTYFSHDELRYRSCFCLMSVTASGLLFVAYARARWKLCGILKLKIKLRVMAFATTSEMVQGLHRRSESGCHSN
jgi:hypothetical protein